MVCKRRSLVVLRYSENEAVIKVVSLRDPEVKKAGLVINELNNTWTSPDMGMEPIKIGNNFPAIRGFSFAIIGVYDRTNLRHLNAMIDLTMNLSGTNLQQALKIF